MINGVNEGEKPNVAYYQVPDPERPNERAFDRVVVWVHKWLETKTYIAGIADPDRRTPRVELLADYGWSDNGASTSAGDSTREPIRIVD